MVKRFCLVILALTLLSLVANEDVARKVLNQMKDSVSADELFKIFHLVYKKDYEINSSLGRKRLSNFNKHLEMMREDPKLEFNMFSDLTDSDFQEEMGMNVRVNMKTIDIKPKIFPRGAFDPINWATHQCGPKHQFATGGDMCFSSALGLVSAIETNQCMKSRSSSVTALSVQQIIDCTSNPSDFFNTYEYYLYSKGLGTASQYPFSNKSKQTCNDSKISNAVRVSSWEAAPYAFDHMAIDIETTYAALKRGPILVSFNFYKGLSKYTSGILEPPASDTTQSCSSYWNGAVVGYGVEKGKEYWIVKGVNGSGWGENGFFKLARNDALLNYGIGCGWSRPQ